MNLDDYTSNSKPEEKEVNSVKNIPLQRVALCSKFGSNNYVINTDFVAAVGMIRKLKQFQN